MQHQAVLLAFHNGAGIVCPSCGANAAAIGPIDVREAAAMVDQMRQQAELADIEPDPIIRNRNIYPDRPPGWAGFRLESLTRDEYNRGAIELVEAWVENPSGSLVLSGETGVGKSTIIAAAANELVEHDADISPWIWGSWSDVLRNAYRQDAADEAVDTFKRRMCRSGILILDEIPAERTARDVENMFDAVIDSRWSQGMATLIGTNASSSAWRDWSSRAYSRLNDLTRGVWLPLSGPDRRMAAA